MLKENTKKTSEEYLSPNSKFQLLTSKTGITLIALIITIIVMLILVVVTINVALNGGLFEKAENAKNLTQLEVDKEQLLSAVAGAMNDEGKVNFQQLDEDIQKLGWTGGSGTYTSPYKNTFYIDENGNERRKAYPQAKIDQLTTENSTINGLEPNENNPVIPKGFKPINDRGANWDAEGGPEVTKGLVISDETSEFVWIPVPNLNDFAVQKPTEDNGKINYSGVLYDLSDTNSYKEPDNLNSYDNTSNLEEWNQTLYQDRFNEMVESIAKYHGFYVGRYETSMNASVAQSKKGEIPMNNLNWYTMYKNSRTYGESKESVTSEMIWGCQWDAMLKFILKGTDASHVKADNNVAHNLRDPYATGGENYDTADVEYNDIACNIYDLEGNVWEWTQEAYSNNIRVYRGGSFYTSDKVSPNNRRNDNNPMSVFKTAGCRLSLYVKTENNV